MNDIPQPQISPERFIWEKYISKYSFSIADVYNPEGVFNPDVEVLGYCPANRLIVRPRTEGWAVLVRFTDTGEEFWLHYQRNETCIRNS